MRVCIVGGVSERGEEGGTGNRSKTQEEKGEWKTDTGNGEEEKCCSGEWEWALNLPSRLDGNHSPQLRPAVIFDMEIHDCVNIWTQCRPNSYITGDSPAAAFTLFDSLDFGVEGLVLKLQAILTFIFFLQISHVHRN